MNGEPSWYKVKWVAKGYKQIYSIDLKETYVVVVKSAMYHILFVLITHFFWYVILMNMVTAFLNSEINIKVYIQLSTGYHRDHNKIALFFKMLYGLKQSTCQ